MKKKEAIEQMVEAMVVICTQNHPDYVVPGTIELGMQALIDLKGADWFNENLPKWPVSTATKEAIQKWIDNYVAGERWEIEKTLRPDGRIASIDLFGPEDPEYEELVSKVRSSGFEI